MYNTYIGKRVYQYIEIDTERKTACIYAYTCICVMYGLFIFMNPAIDVCDVTVSRVVGDVRRGRWTAKKPIRPPIPIAGRRCAASSGCARVVLGVDTDGRTAKVLTRQPTDMVTVLYLYW